MKKYDLNNSSSGSRNVSIIHVISGLGSGGAEMMLCRLLQEWKGKNSSDNLVICLGKESFIADRIKAMGIHIVNVQLHKTNIATLKNIMSLFRVTRGFRPQVIQGWMYHGNLVAAIIRITLYRKAKLIWNVRQTLQNLGNEKKGTQRVINFSVSVSKLVSRIIYNSEESRIQHEALGFKKNASVVIPNGIDLGEFVSSHQASNIVRKSLGISNDSLVVGHVGRFHPKKDHATLIKSLSLVAKSNEKLVLILVGRGVDKENLDLLEMLKYYRLEHQTIMLGEREDVPQILRALDVFVLSSAWGEGFPNVLVEAMATEVCCIATDVGESSRIMSPDGVCVKPRAVEELSKAILAMLRIDKAHRLEIGSNLRKKVQSSYSIDKIGEQYMQLYRDVLR